MWQRIRTDAAPSEAVSQIGPVQISPRPRPHFCPLFILVRIPRRLFAPVAPKEVRSRLRRPQTTSFEFMHPTCFYSVNHLPGCPDHSAIFRIMETSTVTARTLQGMARVRSGQAPAWPLASDRSVRSGSRVKRDFACTLTGPFPPVPVALRAQSRLGLEGRTRTLSGPSPDRTSSVSSLLGDLTHLRRAWLRCPRHCSGVAVTTLGRSSHRARGGHAHPSWRRVLNTRACAFPRRGRRRCRRRSLE
jgi:hypothetical protein